jgi:polyisoprenoid-binding protein YceI
MTFKSTKIEKKDDEDYAVTGDLTLHGVTKSVTFAVEGPSAPGKNPGVTPALDYRRRRRSIVRILV